MSKLTTRTIVWGDETEQQPCEVFKSKFDVSSTHGAEYLTMRLSQGLLSAEL
jgi:hypothetical protein